MTPTHDTAAALEAAIRTFGVCAYSPSEPSDPYGIAGAHIWIEIEDYAAPLKAAITAHVEAEVARRLAAAPDVEAAIVRHDDDTYWRGYRHGGGKVPPDWEDVPRDDHALRVAIAADRARAVEAVGRVDVRLLRDALRYVTAWGCVPGGSEEWKARNQDRVEDELRAAIRRGLDGGDVPARPTSDEARRLVDALEEAAQRRWMCNDEDGPAAVALLRRLAADCDAARAALLRALGVEA